MLESVTHCNVGKLLAKAMNYNNLKEKKNVVRDVVELGEGLARPNVGRVNCLLLL